MDISKFPTPIWHVNDGGRYIGTGCYSVTMDPDERWINVGCYRAMIQDQRSVSLLIVPGKHGYMHREKYFRRGEKMPLVIVVGGDPLFFSWRERNTLTASVNMTSWAACAESPWNWCAAK